MHVLTRSVEGGCHRITFHFSKTEHYKNTHSNTNKHTQHHTPLGWGLLQRSTVLRCAQTGGTAQRAHASLPLHVPQPHHTCVCTCKLHTCLRVANIYHIFTWCLCKRAIPRKHSTFITHHKNKCTQAHIRTHTSDTQTHVILQCNARVSQISTPASILSTAPHGAHILYACACRYV